MSHHDSANRLEAFSDGVFAIIVTVTVLELKQPVGTMLSALMPVLPAILSYVLSFIFIIIYWNNHHHMLRHVHRVTPGIMWANAHLLFWLSLTPFVTVWLGESGTAVWPAVSYGVVLLLSAIAYYILQTLIINAHDTDSQLVKAVGSNIKGKISPIIYLVAILAALFVTPWISYCLYALVALIWIIPDRRFEEVEG